MLLHFTFIFGFLYTVRISYDDPTLKESVAGISKRLKAEGREKYISSSVNLCGNIRYDNLSYIVTKAKPRAFSNKPMFLSLVYFRKCRRQPKQDSAFGGTKSRSATKNWSGNGCGYGVSWRETNELDDITGFCWDVFVNNLSGSLRFELTVDRDSESGVLKVPDC